MFKIIALKFNKNWFTSLNIKNNFKILHSLTDLSYVKLTICFSAISQFLFDDLKCEYYPFYI